MRYVRIALMATAAACLLPIATPALAELGHPDGCGRCEVQYTAGGFYGYQGVPVVGRQISIPPAATALLAPGPAPVSDCHLTLYGARHQFYMTMCGQ